MASAAASGRREGSGAKRGANQPEPPLVQLPGHAGVREKGLYLGTEHDGAAFGVPVQGLDTEGVPCQEELAFCGAVQREGEHAAQAVEHGFAPLLEAVEHHFRIAFGGKGVAVRDELAPQRAEAQGASLIGVKALGVGAAMGNGVGHAPDGRGGIVARGALIDPADKSAHRVLLTFLDVFCTKSEHSRQCA